MTPEQLQDLSRDPIVLLVIVAVVVLFLALYCICASAVINESCKPELQCENCARQESNSLRCAECRHHHPFRPYWVEKK